METLIDYLQMWEEQQPDKVLYRFVDVDGRELEQYTYQSFAERTRELAAYLSTEVGLEPGDRALLVYPPGLEMVAALIACARIGVVCEFPTRGNSTPHPRTKARELGPSGP